MLGSSTALRLGGFAIALAAVVSAPALTHAQAQPVSHAVAYHGPPVLPAPPVPTPNETAEAHQAVAHAWLTVQVRRVHRAEARAKARARARRRAVRLAALAAAQPAPAPSHTPVTPNPPGGWEGIVESLTDAGSASCAISIFTRESGGNPEATNPGSGAYGIPQALPGDKMASAGADWQTNPVTQIRWGLGYMTATYGSPCAAWAHWQVAQSY